MTSTTTMDLALPSNEDMLGQIKAVRLNSGQKCAIVWTFFEREVWIDEVHVQGSKRALIEFTRSPSPDAIRKIWRLENDAYERIDRIAAEQAKQIEVEREADDEGLLRAAEELGIDLSDVEQKQTSEFVNVGPWMGI